MGEAPPTAVSGSGQGNAMIQCRKARASEERMRFWDITSACRRLLSNKYVEKGVARDQVELVRKVRWPCVKSENRHRANLSRNPDSAGVQ
jgi:hypothetical protein